MAMNAKVKSLKIRHIFWLIFCTSMLLSSDIPFDTCRMPFFFRYLRAVAYRWLVRWICGYMGWDNTRPLPACVYHNIRQKFQTVQTRGYQAAQQRD